MFLVVYKNRHIKKIETDKHLVQDFSQYFTKPHKSLPTIIYHYIQKIFGKTSKLASKNIRQAKPGEEFHISPETRNICGFSDF